MAATSAASFAFCLTPEPARLHLFSDDLFFPGFDMASPLCRSGEYGWRPGALPPPCRGPPVAGLFGRRRTAPGSTRRAATQRRARRDRLSRSKLDIKLVIEHDDHATRHAIEALRLPATYEIVVAPAGWPRTKPRALNIALPLVRGELLVVFDAEDAPAPGQLREAAERFLRSPRELACLQARLAIDNIEEFLANPALRR